MLDQLMSLIRDQSQEAIVNNPSVPNTQNNDMMQSLLGSIMGGMQQEVQKGNLSGLMGLLAGKAGAQGGSGLMNNPIVSGIAANAIRSLMDKFGMSNSSAGALVSTVLPGIISSLINKTSNPHDNSLDFNSILGDLMGSGAASGVASSPGIDFNQLGYALADGKLDMNDLMRMGSSMMGGASPAAPQKQQEGLDLDGLLGGLFGNK